MPLAIGVDVGGTKVAAGVVDDDGAVLAECRTDTPAEDAAATLDAIVGAIEKLRGDHAVAAVGVGAAGFVDRDRTTVLFAPNVSGWDDEPLRARLRERIDLPVVIENDANAAAWGEYRFGAGRGAEPLVLVTVGTGIGSGIVVDGAVLRGHWGVAAEAGHMAVVRDGEPCGCGGRGCWERYASGGALTRLAQARARSEPERAAALLELGGGDASAIEGEHVTVAASAGDPLARELFDTVGEWLGLGLANLAAILDPQRFVVGGGAADAGELLLAPARQAFAEHLTGQAHRPHAQIVAAALGSRAGLVGAADLARTA